MWAQARVAPVGRSNAFARDALAGLTARPKRLPPKYFYDEAGSRLFEQITRLPEYYLTRAELSILRTHAADIARLLPPHGMLVEFGSGSSRKARLLLEQARLATYVPVDISPELPRSEAALLRRDFPTLVVVPVEADFTQAFDLPPATQGPRAGFFPGSTLGNFEPAEAALLLRHFGRMLGDRATLIIGIDLVKDPATLHAAYDDTAGVTARFNLNLLKRMNRELGANFDLASFAHRARYNAGASRIEMHLESLKPQKVKVCGTVIEFAPGETIHTENSYKYSIDSFVALARGAGWLPLAVWTDEKRSFSVHALAREDG